MWAHSMRTTGLLVTLSVVAMLLGVGVWSVHAADPPTTVWVQVPDEEVEVNQEFDVTVWVDDVEDMQAAEISLQYDPDLVSKKGVAPGDWVPEEDGAFNILKQEPGHVVFAVSLLGDDEGISGDYQLITVTFQVVAVGQLELDDEAVGVKMLDSDDEEIDYAFEDATVDLTGKELVINVDGEGTPKPAAGTHYYPSDAEVAVSATPDDCWKFIEWTGDIGTVDNPDSAVTTILMDDDYEITAVFAETFELTFVVTDEYDDPLEGATVELEDVGVKDTDADGQVVFEKMLPDEYTYTVSKTGYDTVSDSVDIVDDDVIEEVTLYSTRYDVTFVVRDEDAVPLEGATVDLADVDTKETDAEGEAVFADALPDAYDYTVSKRGYVPVSDAVQITDDDVTEDVTLQPQTELWVAETGDDEGAGTIDDPFASIGHAIDEARFIDDDTDLPSGDELTIYVMPGTYEKSIEMDVEGLTLQAVHDVDPDAGTYEMTDATDEEMEADDLAVILGKALDYAVDVSADGTSLRGFVVERPSSHSHTVIVCADDVVIANNWVIGSDDDVGIMVTDHERLTDNDPEVISGVAVIDNRVEGFVKGAESFGVRVIPFECEIDDLRIEGNTLSENSYGLALQEGVPAGRIDVDTLQVEGNSLLENNVGVEVGLSDAEVLALEDGEVGIEETDIATELEVNDRILADNTFISNLVHVRDATTDADLVPVLEDNLFPDDKAVVTDAHTIEDVAYREDIIQLNWEDTDDADILDDENAEFNVHQNHEFAAEVTASLGTDVEMKDGDIRNIVAADRIRFQIALLEMGEEVAVAVADPVTDEEATIQAVDAPEDFEAIFDEVHGIWWYGYEGDAYTFTDGPFTQEFAVTLHEDGQFEGAVSAQRKADGHYIASNQLGAALNVAPTFDLTFQVQDEEDDPLEGAEIEVDGVGTETTDADGNAVFADLIPGTYEYTVSKDGYVTVTDEVEVADEDVTEKVTLAVAEHTLTMQDPDGDGEVTPDVGDHVYEHGTVVDLIADPASGWEFDEWIGDVDDPDSAETTITMEQDEEVQAVFSEEPDPDPPPPPPPTEYDLTIEIEGEGSVDPELGTYTYEEGTEVTIEATPDAAGYIFGYWRVDGEEVDVDPPPLTIDVTMDDDKTVTAVFVEPPLVLPYVGETFDPDVGGTLSVEDMFDLNVPAGAIDNEAEIGVEVLTVPDPDEVCQPEGPVDEVMFEISALEWDNDEEQPLQEFAEDVEVTLQWEEDLDTEDAERIHILYHHELLDMWIPLPTDVDVDAQTATAEIGRPMTLVMCPIDKLIDIQGHWGERYILLLSEFGAISGYPDFTFRPDELVNREEFARILVDSAGIEVPETIRMLPLLMEDVDEVSDWAQPYVEAALRERLIAGYDDDTFRPHESVTRAQVATMLSRALGLTPVGEPPFADADEIPDWAARQVAALSELDIIRGYLVDEEYYFRPDEVTTRAEATAFLTRYLEERLRR